MEECVWGSYMLWAQRDILIRVWRSERERQGQILALSSLNYYLLNNADFLYPAIPHISTQKIERLFE